MLNTKEIENVKLLKNINAFADEKIICKIPLFHGTRRYAIEMPDSKRECFYDACDKVMRFAKKLFKNNNINENELNEYTSHKDRYFLGTVVHQYGSSLYEYGDMYLTTSYSNAFGFTHNVGGELGEWAYHQCMGFRNFNITLDDELKAAVDTVIIEYEKYENSEKIILIYYDVKLSDLYTHRGYPFLIDIESPDDEEYMNMRIKDLYDSIDSNSIEHNLTFRLKNPTSYTVYVLKESDFREGFSHFTQIADVDEYISHHNLYYAPKWEI